MNHDEMQLLAKAKEAILRRIEADVSKGRVTGFHLNCIHAVAEIEELVDEAIYFADKKTPKHYFDVLFGKRYDKEDMIVLRENDFMHY